MTNPNEMIAEFMRVFEASLDPRLWIKLISEETGEFREAHEEWIEQKATYGEDVSTFERKAALLKEAADVMYVTTAMNMLMEERENLFMWLIPEEERAEWELVIIESNNTMKVAQAIFGADLLRDAFERVHQSNMSKVGDDGQPVRRKTDGKILKGPNYQPPYLLDLVQ